MPEFVVFGQIHYDEWYCHRIDADSPREAVDEIMAAEEYERAMVFPAAHVYKFQLESVQQVRPANFEL